MSDLERQPSTPQTRADGDGPPWKLIGLLVLAVAVAIFFFQNGEDAPVEFLTFDGTWPVWLVIGVSLLAGSALDRLVSWQVRRARRRSE